MAVDTARKRRAASGVGGPPLVPGVTPDPAKPEAWRRRAGWGWAFTDAGAVVCGTAAVSPRTGGTASLDPRTGGTAAVSPRTGGTAGLTEC